MKHGHRTLNTITPPYRDMWLSIKIGYWLNDYVSQIASIFFHKLTLIPVNICIQRDLLPLPFQTKSQNLLINHNIFMTYHFIHNYMFKYKLKKQLTNTFKQQNQCKIWQ